MSQDSELQKAVLAELGWEPSVTAAHIGVAASAGVVTLTGHVTTYAEKHAAETAATRVKGVKAIAEELEVRLASNMSRSDDAIASAAVDRLAWDVSVPYDSIKVKVEKGWVTLSGQVEWWYQKDAAEQDVRRLLGVLGVSNHITIKPKVNALNLSNDIEHALHRSWFDPKTVHVSAENGTVRLTGTVSSMHDREIAGITAWSAPGATYVENDLAVI